MPPRRPIRSNVEDDGEYIASDDDYLPEDMDTFGISREKKKRRPTEKTVPILPKKPVELPWCADSEIYDLSGFHDFSAEKVSSDSIHKPLYVCPDGHIFMEAFSTISKSIEGFLIAIAEPICRPPMIHEFQITVLSLYSAVSVGVTIDSIIQNLHKFSKNACPMQLEKMIRSHGELFGKLKLVLQDGRYFIESASKEVLLEALRIEKIRQARVFRAETKKNIALSANSRLQKPADLSLSLPDSNPKSSLPSVTLPSESNSKLQKMLDRITEPQESSDSVKVEAYNESNEIQNLLTSEAPLLNPEALGFALSKDVDELEWNASLPSLPTPLSPPKHLVSSFEISPEKVKQVREACLKDLRKPLLEEYDFRNDHKNPSIQISLSATTKIRPYQELALRKMFGNGRACSGIIVLPCGAGKTLVGITAATTLRKSCLVLTSTSVAVEQWTKSFLQFTTIHPSLVISFTADNKQDLPEGPCILCSTYTMLAFTGKRSLLAEKIVRQIASREWGLLIMDEVQFAPAPQFRRVCDIVKSHAKLGLTATLVREDSLIHDLQWLIGPKLYEAHWLTLQDQGYLAKVQCVEIWCSMSALFYREYLKSPHVLQRRLWTCNPNKLRVCEFLIRYHESRGDKIIVFSDNLFALIETARRLKKAMIYGQVSTVERMTIIQRFQVDPTFNVIFLSRVGDNAVDIPCANVIIQISFNFASRRQEAQRLGRILRPKPRGTDEFNAVFYSLLSRDTQELYYADKRQQFIIDQGYSYQVVKQEQLPLDSMDPLIFDDPQIHQELLRHVLRSEAEDFEDAEQTAIADIANSMSKNDNYSSTTAAANANAAGTSGNALSSLAGVSTVTRNISLAQLSALQMNPAPPASKGIGAAGSIYAHPLLNTNKRK